MKIVGGIVTKTSAEKYVEEVVQSNLNLNLDVQSVAFKGRNLSVKYSYTIDYREKQAKMVIEGEVYMQDTDKAMKEFEEKWKKSKTIEQTVAKTILDSVMYTSSAIGTLLAFSIGVPAPLTPSRVAEAGKVSAG
ncbi:hypothetical protein HY989_03180 [Candidatus Micrarchaeota archaeon]|nr:hypothetical protein [Candidatus Micrarchaeota archaeon]